MQEKLREIVANYKKINKNSLSLRYFDGDNMKLEDFKNNLQTNSIFKEKRLIILKNGLANFKDENKLLNLLKKTYPPQIILILLKADFITFSMFEDLSKMKKLAQECQSFGFKISKIKPSNYNPKYYEFFVSSEKETFISTQIGPEIILERDYREAYKIFKNFKNFLSYKLQIVYKDFIKVWENWIFCINEILQYLRNEGRKGLFIQRYKGLGEMNSKQLWETTMNPQNRVLKKVSIYDAEKADELFSVLMGENVEPRKEFIYQHALEYRELDI